MFKELHPNIRIRIYTSFLSKAISSMIFPFMAIYFTKELNATYAGILLMIQVFVQFIASLYGGYFADMVGRKKMMVIGEYMHVFAFLGMITFNSPLITSPWITFFMLLIMAVSAGFIFPASEAMLIDVSTKETRAFMYSINYWANNLSVMLGLIIGGLLFKTHLFELLIGLFILSLVTLWMTVSLITESYTVSRSEQITKPYGLKPIVKSYQTVIRDIPFVLFTLGGIAILAIEFQRNNFIAIRLEEEIVPRVISVVGNIEFTLDGIKLLSLLTVENTLIIVLFTSVIVKWIRNKQEQPIMYIGFLLFGLGYGFLAFSNYTIGLIIAVIVLSIGELMYVPTRQSILADIVDDSRRGAYMAFNRLVYEIGKLFGALGIIVGERIGGYGMSMLYVIFTLVGIILTKLAIMKRNEKTRIQQPLMTVCNSGQEK
ncbi:MDR family MFS transporter [Bacillus solimangrovi]|uniref:MFS transporter n=1 Tax=Bacillus solimangrovi TaxID=1305675 RepID=A0A1E5LAR7_9BACI|nr:MFS transporter [Bacillus solimangrovi]OEH91089.1 MFS transporter [Bacillus solimangrovi]